MCAIRYQITTDGSNNSCQTYGVFAGWCPHGVCYGFHFMFDPEGRKDLFSVIYKYWPEEQLKDTTVSTHMW